MLHTCLREIQVERHKRHTGTGARQKCHHQVQATCHAHAHHHILFLTLTILILATTTATAMATAMATATTTTVTTSTTTATTSTTTTCCTAQTRPQQTALPQHLLRTLGPGQARGIIAAWALALAHQRQSLGRVVRAASQQPLRQW